MQCRLRNKVRHLQDRHRWGDLKMANIQMGMPSVSFPNSLKAASDMGGSDSDIVTPVNYSSVTALRARLAAANAGYYTSAKLDQMTVNDMVFAVRNIDDPTSIASYMTASSA